MVAASMAEAARLPPGDTSLFTGTPLPLQNCRAVWYNEDATELCASGAYVLLSGCVPVS